MNSLRVNYVFGGGLAIAEGFKTAAGTAARSPFAVNIEGQPPPVAVSGFQFLTASGGTTTVRGIGFYPGPNGTVSGTNQPIVDKLTDSSMSDCSQVVNSAFNYTFGAEIPGYEEGVQRISFPAIAGYQLIDTPVDIYYKFVYFGATPVPRSLEFYCVPVGYDRTTPGIFRSLAYQQLFLTTGTLPALCAINAKAVTSIPSDFQFEGTGTLRSVFNKFRELTLGYSLTPGPSSFFSGSISLYQSPS